MIDIVPVSYTHLDVYKRQAFHHLAYAFPHFQSGLVCERHGQDAFGADTPVHHMGDAAGDGCLLYTSESGWGSLSGGTGPF